ncbi:MAG: hypothetical protein OEO23_17045, partial [Gemmatimonadota bacterium]|nr:hypothetical protein [Gemmatimonadota bacterium]
GRSLGPPMTGPTGPLSEDNRGYLLEEARDLYWNELEWENITDEEALEGGPLTELAFPGFLAFVRGLLLQEVMPDSQAPASPRPQVVEDILEFLASRLLELEDSLAGAPNGDPDQLHGELQMTSRLIDLVLYLFHKLGSEDIERVEGERHASA